MSYRKTIPVFMLLHMPENQYDVISGLAYKQDIGICTMFQDLVELGLLTLMEYDKSIEIALNQQPPSTPVKENMYSSFMEAGGGINRE